MVKFPKNKENGFTMIELMTALAVFMIILTAIVGIFVSAVKSQRRALAIQQNQEAVRYLLETMTKEIRMSSINTPDSENSAVSSLNITNSAAATFDYQFDNVNKRLWRGGYAISPENLEIEGGFYILKTAIPATSRVTILMKVRARGASSAEEQSELTAQSTVAAR